MRTRLILVLSLGALPGCTSERSGMTADSSLVFLAQQEHFDPKAYAARIAPSVGFSEAVVTDQALPAVPRIDSSAAMVIRTAIASLEVDSLEAAVAELNRLAIRVGGYVASTSIQVGSTRLRQGVIQVKVPAPRFAEALSGLSPIGKLESVNVSAEDVGEEFVDVSARMENARRLERRLIDLLASRTGKLKDVLDVEQALARVREEIERYEGRVRYLRAHTATSTLSVTVHEPLPIVAAAGRGPISEAFRQAWRNFVVLVSFAVQSLGVIIPLGALVVVVWIARRRVMKQRVA
ncbi:MAG: DUF4349 domain-containing protein [Gemmatimonadales bacterium]